MDRRFATELKFRFEEVEDFGFAKVTNAELLRWYDRERLGRGIWRDVADRWIEMDFDAPLLVGKCEGGWVLAWGEGLQTTPESWISPVAEYAQRDESADPE